MQIVIDIPEEVYKEICDKNYYSLKGKEALRIGVINGIVLPKGHGRLIDADYLMNVSLLHNWHGNNKNIVPYADRRGYRLREREVEEVIINAKPIIEADTESEDEK